MNLPEITHLQFQILGVLMGRERNGQSVRDELSQQGVKKSGPGFYQMMSRLEDAGLVKGWYQQKEIGDQVVKERWYKVTSGGAKAWNATCEFYRRQAMRVGRWGAANA